MLLSFWKVQQNESVLEWNLLSPTDGWQENCLQTVLPCRTNTFTCVTTQCLACSQCVSEWCCHSGKRHDLMAQQVGAIWWMVIDGEAVRSCLCAGPVPLVWPHYGTFNRTLLEPIAYKDVWDGWLNEMESTQRAFKSCSRAAASAIPDRLISTQNTALLGPASRGLVLSVVLKLSLLPCNRDSGL